MSEPYEAVILACPECGHPSEPTPCAVCKEPIFTECCMVAREYRTSEGLCEMCYDTAYNS